MPKLYSAFNGPAPSSATAAPSKVTTGVALKTMLQIATPSTKGIEVVEWGISFDGITTTNTPIQVMLQDDNYAATVTAYAAADVVKITNPNDEATLMTLGTSASGYTASAEGTFAATSRIIDIQNINNTLQYWKQYPLNEEPDISTSRFLKIKVLAAVAVNAYCYVTWRE